ncbi:MAG: restriction endonuclease subunit S [Anaerolineales bacterium]
MLDFSRVSFDKQISLAPKKGATQVQSKWEVRKVGDVCNFEYGKGLPQNKRQPGPYPVIGSNGRVGFHNQYLVEGPAIIVGRKGTAGAVYWEDNNCWPIDTTFYVKLKASDISLRYLYLMLQELHLDKLSGGVGVPGLNRDDVYQQKIPVPPLDVQAQIVDECQAIDAEVEQAEKEVSDCYQIAKEKVQACFAQGQVTALGTLVHINRESTDPTQFPEKSFIYVDIGNVEKGTGVIDYSQVITGKDAPSRARRIAPKGSVIISTVRPNLRGFAFIDRDTADCVFSTGFAVLESKDESVLKNKSLFYAFMFSDDLMAQMIDAMGKAAYPSINQTDIENLRIRVPDVQAQEKLIQELDKLETQLQSARAVIASAPARRRAVLKKYLENA